MILFLIVIMSTLAYGSPHDSLAKDSFIPSTSAMLYDGLISANLHRRYNGEQKILFDNGNVAEVTEYDRGKQIKPTIRYDREGNLLNGLEDTTVIIDGVQYRARGNYRDGIAVGATEIWVNERPVGVISIHDSNGFKTHEILYDHAGEKVVTYGTVLHGRRYYYTKEGYLARQSSFLYGNVDDENCLWYNYDGTVNLKMSISPNFFRRQPTDDTVNENDDIIFYENEETECCHSVNSLNYRITILLLSVLLVVSLFFNIRKRSVT